MDDLVLPAGGLIGLAVIRPYRLFAGYNAWVNRQYYGYCAGLGDERRKAERGAFFGSIHNTLNHLLVVDRMWLDRLDGGTSAAGLRLDSVPYEDFGELEAARSSEDARLVALCGALDDEAAGRRISFGYSDGQAGEETVGEILFTLFNHQAHHRGQVHAMLTGFGVRPRDLDIIDYFEAEPGARA